MERRYVPQNAAEVAKVELLMHSGLGLPLLVCWQILDMAEYWPQVKFTDPRKLDRWNPSHPETMQLHVDIPEVLGFPAMRKVVLVIGGHNIRASRLPSRCRQSLTSGYRVSAATPK